MLTERNIYHPFANKSIGFLINSKTGTHSAEFFVDINLHWQPVQDPNIAIPFVIWDFLTIIAGSFVHYHLWQMLKRGDNLVSFILKAYVIVQMIHFPLDCIFRHATDFIYPLSEVFGSWFCVLFYFLKWPCIIFISFHTTVIAIMRYIFVVHDERVANFGKQRAQHLFYWLLGIVPIVLTVWLYLGANDREFDGMPALNKCNGSHHKIFLLKWGFAGRQSVWYARCGVQCYASVNFDNPASILAILELIQCIASFSLMILLTSNIFEGFIYYRLWAHILKT